MLVSEYIDAIKFKISDPNTLAGKTSGVVFPTKDIVLQSKIALNKYASYVKGIEAIASRSIEANTPKISLPTDAIRAEGYTAFKVFQSGNWQLLAPKDIEYVTSRNASYATSSIITDMHIRGKELFISPVPSTSSSSTTISSQFGDSDTTLTVVSTAGFPSTLGRVTIGDEIVEYMSKSDTQFIGCARAKEGTTAVTHNAGVTVKNNNLHIHYYKLHFDIEVNPETKSILETSLSKTMEICSEHLEVVIDYASYLILSMIDPGRARLYVIDFNDRLDTMRSEISAGRSAIRGDSGSYGPRFLNQ